MIALAKRDCMGLPINGWIVLFQPWLAQDGIIALQICHIKGQFLAVVWTSHA